MAAAGTLRSWPATQSSPGCSGPQHLARPGLGHRAVLVGDLAVDDRAVDPVRGHRKALAARSVDPLQRGGLAFFDRSGGAGRPIAQKLIRQALIGDGSVRVRRLPARRADIWKPIFAAAQAQVGSLLARLAGPGLLNYLARLLVCGLLLRPRRTRLRWAQIEIRRDRQRGARFDGEFVGG